MIIGHLGSQVVCRDRNEERFELRGEGRAFKRIPQLEDKIYETIKERR